MADLSNLTNEFEIRRLIENWALWRDMGDWDRLATVWHPDGRMVTTWGEATGSEFVVRSRRAFEAGVQVLHALNGTSIDVAGTRAVAHTKMQIMQRGSVHGVLVDVVCVGRFCDALEMHDGRWVIRLRQPVYEMDRISPVDPAQVPLLGAELLASFPWGYRHLAYLQSQIGLTVTQDLPGTHGPAADRLRARMARWLLGDDPACLGSSL